MQNHTIDSKRGRKIIRYNQRRYAERYRQKLKRVYGKMSRTDPRWRQLCGLGCKVTGCRVCGKNIKHEENKRDRRTLRDDCKMIETNGFDYVFGRIKKFD